ncbi:MAG TPA: quinone-dependent dihydroorotate dehydrogenase [Rhizomicrobium sp.]|nr:quinone-dependent dihydroorotate dehydrogenase [Rhizomicrobium sp.]
MKIPASLANMGAAALRLLPPETAHQATLSLLSAFDQLLPRADADDPRLAIDVLGLHFRNPIGLAAGFDKDARVPDAMAKFGFGFVECGTVTPRPQSGNPRPRLFRLPADRAVVNRMGFNNEGMEAMARRLERRARTGIVGINIGANKDSTDRSADYREAFARLAPFASYVTVNVSSPNTPGLRGLQNKSELEHLLALLTNARATGGLRVPLLLKIAPDIDPNAADDIAQVTLASGIEGLIVSNTTIARPASLKSPYAQQSGGLSGAPLFSPSTALLRAMRQRVGARLVLVGAGGIASGADVYAKLRAGASLVQLYTALAFEGPGLVARLKRELLDCLARDRIAHLSDTVGLDV